MSVGDGDEFDDVLADGADDEDTDANVGTVLMTGENVEFEEDFVDGEYDVVLFTIDGDGVTVGNVVVFIDDSEVIADGDDDNDGEEEDDTPDGDKVTVGIPVALEEDSTDGAVDDIADGTNDASNGSPIAKTNALPAVSVLFPLTVPTTKVAPLPERATLPAKSLMSRATSPFFTHLPPTSSRMD